MAYTYAFEKLTAWQMARQFAKNLYFGTRHFPKEELFGITSQIRRATISIACNLAEGSAGFTDREKSRFYVIAYGSAVEVVNLLIISSDLEFLDSEQYAALRGEVEKLTFQINRLVQSHGGPANMGDVHEPDMPYTPTE